MEAVMARILGTLYGLVVYVFFLGTFLYAIGFVENVLVPRSIDAPGAGGLSVTALLVNAGLLSLFAVQHSVMARPAFKRWWTRMVPKSVERSTFVLFASLALALLCWQWQPIAGDVWTVTQSGPAYLLQGVSWLGWGTVLVSTFLISHFELFGLVQVFARLRGKTLPEPKFRTPGLYRYVRHPIYLGFILAFWATPTMTVGHLVFAVATTGYILVGIWFEERDLVAQFGERYRRYRDQVGMLLPFRKPASAPRSSEAGEASVSPE
jgi:protein-S-isoprenylcysteine O-methyltransferase Ste14